MDGVPALRFATAARRLGAAARAAGMMVPAFRSPPRVRDASRTLRRYPGGAVVSVRLRGRTYVEVVDDMIDGVLAANRVSGDSQPRLRRAFQVAIGDAPSPAVDLVAEERAEAAAADAPPDPPTLAPGARVAERQTQAA